MFYTNPEYSFRFRYDDDAWTIREISYSKSVLVELVSRCHRGVTICIKAIFNERFKNRRFSQLVEMNKEELRRSFSEFVIHHEGYNVLKSVHKHHDLKCGANGFRLRRLLFRNNSFLYIVSLLGDSSKAIDSLENTFQEMVRTLQFNVKTLQRC